VKGDKSGQFEGEASFLGGLLLIVRAAEFMPVMRAYG
jgi:hypothetical protein